jgi:hypothetical protein
MIGRVTVVPSGISRLIIHDNAPAIFVPIAKVLEFAG